MLPSQASFQWTVQTSGLPKPIARFHPPPPGSLGTVGGSFLTSRHPTPYPAPVLASWDTSLLWLFLLFAGHSFQILPSPCLSPPIPSSPASPSPHDPVHPQSIRFHLYMDNSGLCLSRPGLSSDSPSWGCLPHTSLFVGVSNMDSWPPCSAHHINLPQGPVPWHTGSSHYLS